MAMTSTTELGKAWKSVSCLFENCLHYNTFRVLKAEGFTFIWNTEKAFYFKFISLFILLKEAQIYK